MLLHRKLKRFVPVSADHTKSFHRWLIIASLAFGLVTLADLPHVHAADEIEIFDENDDHDFYFDYDELSDALDQMHSGYRMVLTPGFEYPIDDYTLDYEDGIEIDGGYTVRITSITSSERLVTSAPHGLANGDEIKFFGQMPLDGSGNDELTEGQTYYVIDAQTNDFRVAETSGSSTNVDFSISGDLERLLFGYNHARIVPTSSTTYYNFLLKLNSCDDFVVRNLTFDGKYVEGQSGYENGFKTESSGLKGTLLFTEDCAGTNHIEGVMVANNRGKKGSGYDSAQAMGIWAAIKKLVH